MISFIGFCFIFNPVFAALFEWNKNIFYGAFTQGISFAGSIEFASYLFNSEFLSILFKK